MPNEIENAERIKKHRWNFDCFIVKIIIIIDVIGVDR